MTEFVLEQGNPSNSDSEFADKVMAYANFLSQPLEIWMFIPCDEDGNVLEEPKDYADILEQGSRVYHYDNIIEARKFQQAKERVLFEGFYVQTNYSEKTKKTYKYVRNKFPHVFSFEQLKNNTIDSLLTSFKEEFQLTLTQTAIKQIGL